MYTLYQMQDSGNCYKIRLQLSRLQLPFVLEDVNILEGESRTDQFLQKNPNGRIPLLAFNDTYLAESNAILWYLAETHDDLPDDTLLRARILQWMFFEQYSHEPFIATSRYWLKIVGEPEKYASELAAKKPGGEAALAVMDQHLANRDFFVDCGLSIADIALFAYTHVADEGGFSLTPYDNVRTWIDRVENEAGHISMAARP